MSALARPSVCSLRAPKFAAKLRGDKSSTRCPTGRTPFVSKATASMEEVMQGSDQGMPVVLIDNTADPLATVVTVSFGNVLGQLLDTCEALRRLGLNINRADVTEGSPANRFYITDAATSEKVVKSEMIEQIRMTIINNMLTYHPEAADFLVEGQHIDMPGDHDADENILGARVEPKVKTLVSVETAGSARSKVIVTTTDRPGLLVDIVRTMKDLSLNVISAEIDTIGPKAYDIIYCTYQGAPLSDSMKELVQNALTYYLCRREVESTESY